MREIDVSASENMAKLPEQTFLLYGPTRVGKTTFMGSFPRPLFLADATEKGWDSAIKLPKHRRFEEDVEPIVWGIESQADYAPAIEKARPLVASGRVLSIHVDSISFYADLALNNIIARQSKYDVRSAYGELGNHLRDVRVRTHGLCPIVTWAALARDPSEDNPLGGPLIPGAQGEKFGAGVSFIFYLRKEVPLNPQQALLKPPVHEIRTKQWRNYLAGSRLGEEATALLKDPFVGNYAEFLTMLGYDVDAIRAQLPKLTAPIATKPVATVVPKPIVTKPIITTKPATTVIKPPTQ